MKIVFLMQDTGAVYGAERATIDLARGLLARDVAVRVLLVVETRRGDGPSGLQAELVRAGIPFEPLTTRSRLSRRLVAEIERSLQRDAPYVLHTIGYKADVHGLLAARRVGLPQVATVHGWLFRPDLRERFYGWLDVRVFKRCARVIVLSRYYEDLLRARRVHRVVRLPTGFAAQPLPPAARPARPFTFGLLGRLSWEKNHELFLAAAARLRDGGAAARFRIGGDGPLRDAIAAEIARLALGDCTGMTGYVAADSFFADLDALVICSRVENQPYVVMEAMARGLPVIATRVGGLPDLVDDGLTGRLVPPGDAAALAAAMTGLVDAPDLAARLGLAGRAKLDREFNYDAWVDAHIALYDEVQASS